MNYNIEEKKPIACEKICLAPDFEYLLKRFSRWPLKD